jgi:muramidase (phage lysozyme)
MDNISAFLTMIGVSEGTCTLPQSDNGYNVLVGSTPNHLMLFHSYADHPNIYNRALNSTAAGRYQIIHGTWESYKARLTLPDFSPASQDAVATEIIKDFAAMDAVIAGDIDTALMRLNNQWASFPGGNSGQHQNAPAALRQAFIDAGGTLA